MPDIIFNAKLVGSWERPILIANCMTLACSVSGRFWTIGLTKTKDHQEKVSLRKDGRVESADDQNGHKVNHIEYGKSNITA